MDDWYGWLEGIKELLAWLDNEDIKILAIVISSNFFAYILL